MGKSAAESLRANAIVTADRGGFDVTVEVLNGRLNSVRLYFGPSGSQSLSQASVSYCILPNGQPQQGGQQGAITFQNPVLAGQSVTCRFQASLTPGTQFTYVVYAVDATSGKVVQIAKGVVTAGIS
jgi:hypothetical protein